MNKEIAQARRYLSLVDSTSRGRIVSRLDEGLEEFLVSIGYLPDPSVNKIGRHFERPWTDEAWNRFMSKRIGPSLFLPPDLPQTREGLGEYLRHCEALASRLAQ